MKQNTGGMIQPKDDIVSVDPSKSVKKNGLKPDKTETDLITFSSSYKMSAIKYLVPIS